MTHRDVPRTLAEKHEQHDLAAVARAALITRATRELITTPTAAQRPSPVEERIDERRPPLEEVIDLENALEGLLRHEQCKRVLERKKQRDQHPANMPAD